jgi:hypothetical protein
MTMLPRLDAPYSLQRDCIAAFGHDGHVCVRGLASADEVAAYRPLIDAATMAHRYDKRPLDERDTYGKAFVQSPNLWRREAPIAGFTLARRFARVAAELMGVDGVRVAPPTDFQRGDLKHLLADLPAGELANGPKNPLVWSRNQFETTT